MSWDETELIFETCLEQKKFFNETDIQRIMRDLVIGLDFLHSSGVVHRDIKPQNIMLDENGKAKYADFGESKLLSEDNDNMDDQKGTELFLAPECLGSFKSYAGKPADVWALGITLFAFTYNKLPWYADSSLEIQELVTKTELQFPENRNVSQGLKDIITKMLDKNPKTRMTVTDLKANEWLNNGFQFTLAEEEAHMGIMGHYKKEDNRSMPVSAVMYAQKMAKKFHRHEDD